MKLKSYALLFSLCLTILIPHFSNAQHSAAREWNETLLFAISADFARPTVHARNLFHASIVMYDAWAVYEEGAQTYLMGQNLNGYSSAFLGAPGQEDILAAQEEALSFAMFRLISHRYSSSPGVFVITDSIQNLMDSHGYDYTNASIDYLNGGPAELGNYIAKVMIGYGFNDGANEGGDYGNLYYEPLNPPIEVENPGNPDIVDPNRWQQITLSESIDQSGEIVANTPDFLSPEWGDVHPFSMTDEDLTVLNRDGHDYNVYHNPGPPALLDVNNPGGIEDPYKWNFMLVPIWQSHLSIDDDEVWDISPASIGNISEYPDNQAEMESFYNFFEGGDPGEGYNVNPATGLPYSPQMVKRADYARVLAEFWADGPNSVTPPGHWFDLLNGVTDHPLFERKWMGVGPELDKLQYDVKAYLAMGGAMHDAAIAAWSIKGYYDYLRPVSAVRYLADNGQCSDINLPNYSPLGAPLLPGYVELVTAGDPLAGVANEHVNKIKLYTWKGPDYIDDPATEQAGVDWILAENWWPYQRPSFVTPPFSGYLSGHSTYSRTAAELMTLMTGDAFFPGGMSGYTVEQNDFLVFEEGPSESLTLQWATYRDASDQCSLSRIWGGIHPPVDDIPGRKIGMDLGPEAFNFADNIVTGSAPFVESIVFSDDSLSMEDLGNMFTITINYNEEMNTSIIPLLVFQFENPTVSALTFINAFWESQYSYTFTYTFDGEEEELHNIVLSATSAVSATDKPQIPYTAQHQLFVDSKKPLIDSSNIDVALITDATTMDQSFSISILMDEDCNPTIDPNITFDATSDVSAAISHNVASSQWQNGNEYIAQFTLTDTGIEVEDISVNISNIEDAFGNTFDAATLTSQFSMDTKNPSASEAVVNNANLIQTDQGGSALIVELTFDEDMNSLAMPELTFMGEDPLAASLVLNPLNSIWTSSTSCQITYDLLLAEEELYNIVVSLESFNDLAGNMGVSDIGETLFTIDTKTPQIELLSYSTELISDQDIAGGFEVHMIYSEPMNTTQVPLVVLSGSELNGSLTYNIAQSIWDSETTFIAKFDVTDEDIETDDIALSIDFAIDFSGNAQSAFSLNETVAMDTKNPNIVSASASDYSITDENVGTDGLNIVMIFDEAMDELITPTFTFVPEDPATSILSVNAGSEWLNPYSYSANFDVADSDAIVNELTVNLGNSQDIAGNEIVNVKLLEFLSIDMSPTGIEDLKGDEGVQYFPNPIGSGNTTISMETKAVESNVVVSLFDTKGQLLFITTYGKLQPAVTQLQLPSLSVGMYFFDFKSDNTILRSKILVQ